MTTPTEQPPSTPRQLVDLPDFPHAWSTEALWLWDTLRAGLVLTSLYLIYLLAFAAVRTRSPHQRALTVSFVLAVMLSVWTQVERIGRPVSWRLPVALAMVALGIWGVLRYMTGGRRLRDFTIRSFFAPPIPQPLDPPDVSERLRKRPPPQGPSP